MAIAATVVPRWTASRGGKGLDKIFVEFTKNPTGRTKPVFSYADMSIVAAIKYQDRCKLICPISTLKLVGQHILSILRGTYLLLMPPPPSLF